MQAYITRSTLKIFINFYSMIGHWRKINRVKFPKKSFGQMGNGHFMAQNYVSLYLRVCSKDIFQILQHHRTVSVDKNY